MTATPPKCHPHFCPFDSPACTTQCDCVCNRIKPDCISVTAQQALNIPELKFQRSDTGVPVGGISTRERVFGIPYDPRKDFDIPVPQRDIDRYLGENYETMDYRAVKEYATNKCCAKTCRCILGPNCRCRQSIDRKNNTRFKNCNNS